MDKSTTVSFPAAPLATYRIESLAKVMTPALAIYVDVVDSNIQTTLGLLDGKPERWRPHVKTTKLAAIMARLIANGISNFKCATTLELLTVCETGARDVVVAYPCLGARARRIQQIASIFPDVRISVLLENESDVDVWRGTRVGAFVDVNPGMNRTGIEENHLQEIVSLAQSIQRAGISFRGIHYYDGQRYESDLAERTTLAHRGYDQLLRVVGALKSHSIATEEVITSGTPAFPCALSYPGFQNAGFIHRMSPGTLVYGDTTSLCQLPNAWDYQPAALVISTVVSHPENDLITCDAGHKTVSADSGIPNCAILGHPELIPLRPSEEHLPIRVESGYPIPRRGDTLYLVPRHVCPTVNNFDHCLMISQGRITGIETVTARGREAPITVDGAGDLGLG
jgi:D-serine deaminase-like pyridoxal phosphate-dependent protein